MPAYNQNTQVTSGLNSNQDPNEYRIVYCDYEYNNKEQEKISDPNSNKNLP
ncbi:MAG: hypothetical protein JO327_13670 [Nitrososphaeraceae archaeon]|nr:hypothetical protein [Nitrososphaeraceae archaeon]MBV9669162.1 hypothetical protein [Nitrososphaeraceae archaeon]